MSIVCLGDILGNVLGYLVQTSQPEWSSVNKTIFGFFQKGLIPGTKVWGKWANELGTLRCLSKSFKEALRDVIWTIEPSIRVAMRIEPATVAPEVAVELKIHPDVLGAIGTTRFSFYSSDEDSVLNKAYQTVPASLYEAPKHSPFSPHMPVKCIPSGVNPEVFAAMQVEQPGVNPIIALLPIYFFGRFVKFVFAEDVNLPLTREIARRYVYGLVDQLSWDVFIINEDAIFELYARHFPMTMDIVGETVLYICDLTQVTPEKAKVFSDAKPGA